MRSGTYTECLQCTEEVTQSFASTSSGNGNQNILPRRYWGFRLYDALASMNPGLGKVIDGVI